MIEKKAIQNELRHLITDVVRGVAVRTPKISDADTVEVINIKDINDGRIDTASLEKRVVTSAKSSNYEAIREGDIVIATRGPQFRVGVADKQAEGHLITSNLIALRLDQQKVLPGVLAAYLNSPDGQHNLTAISKGVTVPSIGQKELLGITVPLPPMEAQQHIKDYLQSTEDYLTTLRAEEETVKKIRDYAIFRSFEVKV
ncbi:restriction endonuclease subunit S [Methanoculleus sp. 7T]|jgi:type I restriction enzyme M protein|uniref:restriction endonuclease subunit S n=1 Tax=Methanoculleus sp. 7T TaxID=2937282 RepID=UPI0020C0A78D|nr:restriction endonuclease subunit S [Methanoculleus sp. 7T]MCK8517701.1 restriction endonuclease subunit S [Methanoculleus sp. 7T]